MTPKQQDIARARADLDTEFLLKVLTWYISESGHPGFEDFTPPSQCPKPTVIADPPNPHNTDEKRNPNTENQFEGGTFRDALPVYELGSATSAAVLELLVGHAPHF